MSGSTRRLAAVLAADVVGYSAQMGADDTGTLARVRALRANVIEPHAATHGGRLFKTMGDGFLLEFASAVQALQCAIAIQSALNAQPDGLRLRIGVHQGEVVDEGGDLFGDGVIVAARLEPLAEHGGIVISSRVREDAAGKMPLDVENLGEPPLKNITAKIHAFRVLLTASAAPALTLPDRPSIAVLPFRNMSSDPDQDYFGDGVVEEITTALSRIKWLFVISQNSTVRYKNNPAAAKTASRELGVRYLLEGSVRRSGGRVRVAARLIDGETEAQVWADRYDRAMDDIFALQDELAISVIGAIEPTLLKAEIERARRKRPGSLDAYDLYLRALPLAATGMPDDAEKALDLLQQAVRLDPDYAAAHGYIAWCQEQRYLRGGLSADIRESARHHAHAAIAAGSDDATALAMGGFVAGVIEHDYDTALDALDRALSLSPSSALAYGFSAIIRAWKGDDDMAIAHGKAGIRHGPYDPLIYLAYVGLAYAHLFTGQFEEAVSAANRAMAANPRFSVPCYLHAAAQLRLGRHAEAKVSAALVLERQPGFTIGGLAAGNFTSADRMAGLTEALRRAGLPP